MKKQHSKNFRNVLGLGIIIVLFVACGFNNNKTAEKKDSTNMAHPNPDSANESKIISPDPSIIWGKEVHSLRLGAVLRDKNQVDVYFQNVGTMPVELWSYSWVGQNAKEYDFLQLLLIAEKSEKKYSMWLASGIRQMAAPVYDTLKRGEFLNHTIDVEKWRTSEMNKLYPISAGKYKAVVVYENTNKTSDLWNGHLESDTIKIQLK
jgi:hypothetical protein